MLVIHYLRKMNSDDPMDQISGTLGLTGAADGMLVLTRERGKADAVLHVTGRDIEEDGEYALEWIKDIATWAIMGHVDELQPSRERDQILRCFRDEGELNIRQLSEFLKYDYTNLRQIVLRMENDGTLKRTGGSRNTGYTYTPITTYNN